jgi:hypothetical protein
MVEGVRAILPNKAQMGTSLFAGQDKGKFSFT